jgi:hypothetical protein
MTNRFPAPGAFRGASHKPRVLLVATLPWVFPARLASALSRAGFHVEAACQLGHPLRYLSKPVRTHRLGWLFEEASIEAAIGHANCDLVLPCDDPAVAILQSLHRRDAETLLR